MLSEFKELTNIGFDIIPCGHESKNPGENVGPWQEQQWDNKSIENHFSKYSNSGIGIRLNGNIIDIEYDHGDGESEVAALVGDAAAGGTASWRSSRGVHRLYILSPPQVLALVDAGVSNRVKIGNLEIHIGHTSRVFCVLPPTGGREWVEPPTTILPLPAEAFDAILATAKPKGDFVPYDGPLRPGDKLAQEMSWGEILEPHGWRDAGTMSDKILWRRPGKAEGHSATEGHYIDELTGEPKLHVFSDNAEPFEANKSYDKFSAWCLLNHEGDYKAAASAAISIVEVEADGSEFGLPETEEFPVQEITNNIIFPEFVLDDPFGEFALAIKDKSIASTTALFLQFHEFAFNFYGRRPHILWSGNRYYLNNGLLIVANTGSGKGVALDNIKQALKSGIDEADEFEFDSTPLGSYLKCNVAGGFQSGQSIMGHFATKDDAKNIVVNSDQRLLISEEEISSLFKLKNMDNSILSQTLRCAISGGRLEYRSAKNGKGVSTIVVDNPHVSVVGHSTRTELLECMSVSGESTGELNRFQFAICNDSKFVPFSKSSFDINDIPEAVSAKMFMLRNYNNIKGPVQLNMSNEAIGLFDSLTEHYYNSVKRGDMNPRHARRPINTIKWAARFSFNDGRSKIERVDMEKAIALTAFIESCMDDIMSDWSKGIDKDDVEKAKVILSENPGGIFRTKLAIQIFGTNWKKEKMDHVEDKLIKSKIMTVKKKGKGVKYFPC